MEVLYENKVCNVCADSAPVMSRCSDCDKFMCKNCHAAHQRDESTRNHKTEVINKDVSQTKNVNCKVHPSEVVEYLCKNDDQLVCGVCITGDHHGHDCDKVKKVLDDEKYLLGKMFTDLEKVNIPKVEADISCIQQERKLHEKRHVEISNNVNATIERILSEIRAYQKELLRKNQNIHKKTDKKLADMEHYAKTKLNEFRAFGQKKNILSGNAPDMIEMRMQISLCVTEMDSNMVACDDLATQVTEFTEGKGMNKQRLKDVVGCITSSELVTETISKFRPKHNEVLSVCPVRADIAFLSYVGETGIVKINGESIQDQVEFHATPFYMDRTSDRCIIISNFSGRRILMDNIYCNNLTHLTFTGPLCPLGLCVTYDGDILVCMVDEASLNITPESKRCVVRMTRRGQTIRTIEYDQENFRLFTYPIRVSENPVTEDVCVVDKTGDNIGHLSLLDKTGNLKTKYAGDRHEDQFDPADVVCDKRGQIILADHSNQKVHLLDRNGQFLCYLLTQKDVTSLPASLALDATGRLWMGTSYGYVYIIKYKLKEDLRLHKAKDAWKPNHKKEEQEKDSEDLKSEELHRKARSILNKLTPQKFQTLVKQMAELQIDSEQRLKDVTDLIFETAISEPRFSVAYASMCRYLTQLKVPSETAAGGFVNFRAILLTRSQKEFEKDKEDRADIDKRRKELEEAKEDQKKLLQEELEMTEWNARRRSLGNIRFIGELFKLKMLTVNIMHDCVLKLLRAKEEESLECLCRLLSTIGKELDSDKARPRMDQYFNQMNKIILEKKTSSRVRFMLQDVIELRQNKWVPRRDENNPKTIDQIHKEVQLEEHERALMRQQAAMQQRDQGGPGEVGGGNRRGSRSQNPPQPMMSHDGWNTVVGKPSMNVRQPIDPSRLKITKQNVDEISVQFGPGGGAGRFSGWQRGSTRGGARISHEAEKPAGTPSNRFSALDDSRSRFSVCPARGGGRGRQQGSGFGLPPSCGITPRSSQGMLEKEGAAAVRSARNIAGGQTTPKEGPSREGSQNREAKEKEREEKPSAAPAKQLSAEKMEKKTISILDEYLRIQDKKLRKESDEDAEAESKRSRSYLQTMYKEAILCVEDLNSPSTLHIFVSTALNYVLERSEVARQQTGLLLHELVKKEIVSVQNYLSGLNEILQFADDMEIDIPQIWQYFGELIGPMVHDGSVPLSFLKQACTPLKASNKAGKLVAEVLHAASHREGHKKVGDLWRSSGLQWSDFVAPEEVKQFLKDKKLEFTDGDGSQPTTPTAAIPMEKVQEKLILLLTKQAATNEKVIDWIEANLDDRATKTKKFVRALMTSVCSSAISGSGYSAKVDPRGIKNRGALLQKYLDHQAEFELQALYALQVLVHQLEHPPGVIRTLFDTLYDEDIISEDAFNQWEKSNDPAEQEGKGVAMKHVVQFFKWLREPEDESDN